jgi:hypothetical protein
MVGRALDAGSNIGNRGFDRGPRGVWLGTLVCGGLFSCSEAVQVRGPLLKSVNPLGAVFPMDHGRGL